MSVRVVTAGESHGPGLTCIVEGLPAGLQLDGDAINRDMQRRQLGHGRGGRMKIERDAAEVTSGVRHGRTLGGPIALSVRNRDFENWRDRMNPWPVEAEVAGGAPPAAGPRRPRRRAEVRLHRRAQRARARQRARDGGAGGGRRAGEGVPGRPRRPRRLARDADRVRARAGVRRPARSRTSPTSTPRPCAAWTRTRRARWSRRSTCCASATSRSAASSRCARSAPCPGWARTSPGRSAWTAGSAWRCSRSRRSRAAGSATGSTSRAAPAPRPTTRSSTPRSAATTARPTARAASRAG